MKLISLECKNCGGTLEIGEGDSREVTCPYCGGKMLLDNEEIHVKYDGMQQAGYEFAKGKLQAEAEAKVAEERRMEERENKQRQRQILGYIINRVIILVREYWFILAILVVMLLGRCHYVG